jgi:hypothetical protein
MNSPGLVFAMAGFFFPELHYGFRQGLIAAPALGREGRSFSLCRKMPAI